MNTVPEVEPKENRFKKILDDAGRSLEDTGNYRFLDNLPKVTENDEARIPFPYGPQPEHKTGWK